MSASLSKKWGIVLFGSIEVAIGAVTLIAVLISLILGESSKPTAVLIFVLITSFISLSLGLGILKHNLSSYHLLLFFATLIIISKVLIFSGIIILSGALETNIPQKYKDTISIIYHCLLIWYFLRPSVRGTFGERRSIFSRRIR